MKHVNVIVEGQTEEAFIKDVVAPSLYHLEVYLYPRILRTSATGRGGAVTYDRFSIHTRNTLRQNPTWFLTTFLDLYGLHTDFPGFLNANSYGNSIDRTEYLEKSLHREITSKFVVRTEQFIPHIQPYEYEGLLFSNVDMFEKVEPRWASFLDKLHAVRDEFETPEHINNSYETAPSKRLEKILSPKYRKVRHGPILAKSISLSTIERECTHFRQWMDKLRNLPNL